MSMHKIPLTQLEEDGLRAHGLDIGSPSQLSDVFRHGIKWALEQAAPQPEQRGLVDAVREAVVYLDSNGLNSIASGSTCHRRMRNALSATPSPAKRGDA